MQLLTVLRGGGAAVQERTSAVTDQIAVTLPSERSRLKVSMALLHLYNYSSMDSCNSCNNLY